MEGNRNRSRREWLEAYRKRRQYGFFLNQIVEAFEQMEEDYEKAQTERERRRRFPIPYAD
jgi:hypothetical protein